MLIPKTAFLRDPRAYCYGSQGEGVGGFRIEVVVLTGAEAVVGAKDEHIPAGLALTIYKIDESLKKLVDTIRRPV